MAAAERKGQYITELNKNDVLCGRGSGPNEREGNIHFRDLVSTSKAEYLAINPRDHQNKNRIAREIVETVRSRGGRFLKRAVVDPVEGEPGSYELADEPAVLEKAKQALRQNRAARTELPANTNTANVCVENQSNPVIAEGTPSQHVPAVNSNPYQAFMAHLQQSSMPQSYGVSPAEVAMQNLQMQNFMAQNHESIPPRQNPYFAASGAAPGLVDPQQSYRDSFAMLQHFKAQQQQQALPNNIMSGYQNPPAASPGLSGEAEIRYYLEQQRQHKMNAQISRAAGENAATAAAAAASRSRRSDHSISSFSLNSAESAASVSDSRMKALENLFINASQKMTGSNVESRAQHHHAPCTRANSHGTIAEGSFAEGLEDMSLPSMSIGEISDFTPQGESLSRSKRSAGGRIIDSSERSSCSMSMDGSANSGNRLAARQEGIAVGTGMLSQERNKGYDANRHVSFVGNEHPNMSNEAVAVAQQMRYAHATQQQQMSHPSHYVHRNTDQPVLSQSVGSKHSASQKKQRRSLSSYYRELREAHAGDCPPTADNNDAMAMSSIDEDGWH